MVSEEFTNRLADWNVDGNLDLAVARERVIEAQALVRTVPSEVAVTGSAQAGRGGGDGVVDGREAEATFGLSWLFDPYGGRRSRNSSAKPRTSSKAGPTNGTSKLAKVSL